MSQPGEPVKGGLFCGFMLSPSVEQDRLLAILSDRLGTITLKSEPFDFDFTRYYEREMGPGLLRMYCFFKDLVSQGNLADIKNLTNGIEAEYTENRKRKVNLDPGILTANRLVLASGKDAPHRIYLANGIFAEVTLNYESGEFVKHPWTYPDFQDPRTLDFLHQARKYYLECLKAKPIGKE